MVNTQYKIILNQRHDKYKKIKTLTQKWLCIIKS